MCFVSFWVIVQGSQMRRQPALSPATLRLSLNVTWETRIPTDTHSPTWKTNIPSNRCSPTCETEFLVICVPSPGKHISVVICVSLPGKHYP